MDCVLKYVKRKMHTPKWNSTWAFSLVSLLCAKTESAQVFNRRRKLRTNTDMNGHRWSPNSWLLLLWCFALRVSDPVWVFRCKWPIRIRDWITPHFYFLYVAASQKNNPGNLNVQGNSFLIIFMRNKYENRKNR